MSEVRCPFPRVWWRVECAVAVSYGDPTQHSRIQTCQPLCSSPSTLILIFSDTIVPASLHLIWSGIHSLLFAILMKIRHLPCQPSPLSAKASTTITRRRQVGVKKVWDRGSPYQKKILCYCWPARLDCQMAKHGKKKKGLFHWWLLRQQSSHTVKELGYDVSCQPVGGATGVGIISSWEVWFWGNPRLLCFFGYI